MSELNEGTFNNIKCYVDQYYRQQTHRQGIFFFVEGAKAANPELSIMQCLEMFRKKNDLDDENFNLRSASKIYNDIKKMFYTAQKTNNNSL